MRIMGLVYIAAFLSLAALPIVKTVLQSNLLMAALLMLLLTVLIKSTNMFRWGAVLLIFLGLAPRLGKTSWRAQKNQLKALLKTLLRFIRLVSNREVIHMWVITNFWICWPPLFLLMKHQISEPPLKMFCAIWIKYHQWIVLSWAMLALARQRLPSGAQ